MIAGCKSGLERRQEFGVQRWLMDKSIVHPASLATRGDQSGVPENGQMAGNPRLRDIQNTFDVTHAQLLPLEQEIDDPQAIDIRESLKKTGEFFRCTRRHCRLPFVLHVYSFRTVSLSILIFAYANICI